MTKRSLLLVAVALVWGASGCAEDAEPFAPSLAGVGGGGEGGAAGGSSAGGSFPGCPAPECSVPGPGAVLNCDPSCGDPEGWCEATVCTSEVASGIGLGETRIHLPRSARGCAEECRALASDFIWSAYFRLPEPPLCLHATTPPNGFFMTGPQDENTCGIGSSSGGGCATRTVLETGEDAYLRLMLQEPAFGEADNGSVFALLIEPGACQTNGTDCAAGCNGAGDIAE